MRIVVHGQQAFGRAVLERLLENGEDVVAVCTAPEKEGRPTDPLADLARENGLPLHQPASWKTQEALELMQSFNADVCMMAYVLLFVPEAVRDAPKHGTFQYHPSICPHHRGPSSINWPIAMGKKRTGLTIFWPDDGLDEGPIMLQKTCEIGDDETLGDVYFKKLFPMGVDAMIEGLELVKSGIVIKHEQRLADGSYESWFKKDLARIDWSKSVDDIYNLIRAANPAPGAWSMLGEAKIDFFDSAKGTGEGVPGTVLGVSEDGIEIAASGGSIVLKRLRVGGEKAKVLAADYAAENGVAVGKTFG
ncbi:MAG: methionyl-tRNA formyltransferase [Pseudomonadota bacterium]